MTWCDTWHICNETSAIGPGLGGCRDRSGTQGGMSHNTKVIPAFPGKIDVGYPYPQV